MMFPYRPTKSSRRAKRFTLARVPGSPKGKELKIGPVALRQRLDRGQSCAHYPQEPRKNDHTEQTEIALQFFATT
jgi:hypothetical protein